MPATQKALRLDLASKATSKAWSKHQEEDGGGAPEKRKSTAKKKPVQYGRFSPGMAVAVRHNISEWPAGESSEVWIDGYEVHDPEAPNASRLKQRPGQMSWVPIVRQGEHESRAVFYKPDMLEPIEAGKHYYAFGDIYQQSKGGGTLGKVEKGEVVELNDRENEALIRETVIREATGL